MHNTKNVQTTTTGNPDALLSRELGTRQLAATIFNYTVGSGIFVLPAFAVLQLGTAAPLAYVACAVIIGLVVLCFAEAGSRVSATGGPYAYVETALGPFVGFIAGWFVVSRWREERQGGAVANDLAVRRAMEHGGAAVVFSGSTVAISLLALLAVPALQAPLEAQDTAAQPNTVINKAVGQPKDTVRSMAGRPPRAIQPGWWDAPRKLPMAKVGKTAKEMGAPAPAL